MEDDRVKRKFNVTGFCIQQKHYMVKLDDRLKKIREEYVDEGVYFVINRERQYGKTTLRVLAEYLKDDYLVFSMDFQMMSTANFANEQIFVISFIGYIEDLSFMEEELVQMVQTEALQDLRDFKKQEEKTMKEMSACLSSARQPKDLSIHIRVPLFGISNLQDYG